MMMRTLIVSAFLIAGLVLGLPGVVHAEATEITVRVLSKDAKFVGTSMGGVRISLRDAQTGEVLARGVTAGGTGNTERIMHIDRGRRAVLSGDSAAAFRATLELDEPRLVEAVAYGPLAQPQAAHRVMSTQWVVPGRHLSGGDGWVLELPGFVVDVLSPPAHQKLPSDTGGVQVSANVTMMCGCPIKQGGLWDAERYDVAMIVSRNGERVNETEMAYAGTTSQFKGTVPVDGSGVYEVTVYAHDPNNGNTGLDRTTFVVR